MLGRDEPPFYCLLVISDCQQFENSCQKYLSILVRQLKDENSSLREQLREIDESSATHSSCFSDASSSISSNSFTTTDRDSFESGSSEYNSIKLHNKISQNEDRDRLHEKIKDLEDELAKKTEEFSQLEVSFQGKCASQQTILMVA